jgi:hypothetical protein
MIIVDRGLDGDGDHIGVSKVVDIGRRTEAFGPAEVGQEFGKTGLIALERTNTIVDGRDMG